MLTFSSLQPSVQRRIPTIHYFSIGLFRQSLRSGFGVDIAPDGICSARLIRTDLAFEKGVHTSEPKRIKKMIREYLDAAAKQRPKGKKGDSLPVGAERSDSLDAATAPPLPPRSSMSK